MLRLFVHQATIRP